MYRYIGIYLFRNIKKNILISLITIFFIFFLISYESTLTNTKNELEHIYDTTVVTASFVQKQQGTPLYIHYNLVKQILDTGFIESYNTYSFITGSSVSPQVYFPIGIPEEDYPRIIGATSDVIENINITDIYYIGNYDSSILNRMEKVCLVSNYIMSEFHISYGDEIRLGALMVDVGVREDDLKNDTYRVIGSFDGMERTSNQQGSKELGYLSPLDIVIPYESYMTNLNHFFNNTLTEAIAKEYMSVENAIFILKDTRNLSKLRSQINKMPFKKDANYSSDSIYFNVDFQIEDELLNKKVTPLHQTIYRMENGKLAVYIIISMIGILISYLMYQSYRKEKEIMSLLGQSLWSTYTSFLGYMMAAPMITMILVYVTFQILIGKNHIISCSYFFVSYCVGFHISYEIDTRKKG